MEGKVKQDRTNGILCLRCQRRRHFKKEWKYCRENELVLVIPSTFIKCPEVAKHETEDQKKKVKPGGVYVPVK